MAERYRRVEVQSERVSRNGSRRRMDEVMLAGVSSSHDQVVHVGVGRWRWWRARRRFRRRYGVVATHLAGNEWKLRQLSD
jgi:hypothetical protein